MVDSRGVTPPDDGADQPAVPPQEATAILLQHAQDGDKAARNRLIGRFLPVLTQWAHHRLPNYARDLSETGDKFLLFATAEFAALPGAPTPDFIIPAGQIPFIGIGVDETIKYFPAAGYDTISFSADALPTDGINSLNFDLTTGPNSPTGPSL